MQFIQKFKNSTFMKKLDISHIFMRIFKFYFGLPLGISKDIDRIFFFVIYPYIFFCLGPSVIAAYAPFYFTKLFFLSLGTFFYSFIIDTYLCFKISIFLIYFLLKILIFHPLAGFLSVCLLIYYYLIVFIHFNYYKYMCIFKALYLFFVSYNISQKVTNLYLLFIFLFKKIVVANLYLLGGGFDSHIIIMLTNINTNGIEDYQLMKGFGGGLLKIESEFVSARLKDREIIMQLSNQYLHSNYYLDILHNGIQYFLDLPYRSFPIRFRQSILDAIENGKREPTFDEMGGTLFGYYFFGSCMIGFFFLIFFFFTKNSKKIHCQQWYNITGRIMLFLFIIWGVLEIIIFTIDIDLLIGCVTDETLTSYRRLMFEDTTIMTDILITRQFMHGSALAFLLVSGFLMGCNLQNNVIFFVLYNAFFSNYMSFTYHLCYSMTIQRIIGFFGIIIDKLVYYYYSILKHPSHFFELFTIFDFFFLSFIILVLIYLFYLLRLMFRCVITIYRNIIRPAVKAISRNSAVMLALCGRAFVDEDDYIERIMESELNIGLGVVLKRSNIENRREGDEFVEIDAFIINLYLTAGTFAYEEKLRRIEFYMLENLDLTRIGEPIFDSTKFKYPLRPDADAILKIRNQIYDIGEEKFYNLSVEDYGQLFVPIEVVNIDDVKYYDITNEVQRNMNDGELVWDEERHPYHYSCNLLRITGRGFHEQIQSFTYKDYGEIARKIMIFRILYGEPGYLENPDIIIDELYPIHEELSNEECFCEQDELDLKNKILKISKDMILFEQLFKIKINGDFIDGITIKSPKYRSLVNDFEPMLECLTAFEKEREGFLRKSLGIEQEVSVRAFIPTKAEAMRAPGLVSGGLGYRTHNYLGISTTITIFEIMAGKDKLLILQNIDAIRKQLERDPTLINRLNVWVRKEVYKKEEKITVFIQEMPFYVRRGCVSKTKVEGKLWELTIFTPDSFENYYDKSKNKPHVIKFTPVTYDKLKEDLEYYDEIVLDPRIKKKKKKKINLFKERKFMKYKRLQKFRQKQVYYNFLHFKNKSLLKMCSILYSLNNVKLFPFHLKLFRFFFNRFKSKTKHVSRRERFKRANKKSSSLESLKLEKKGFYYNKFIDTVTYIKKKERKILQFKFFKLIKRKKHKRMYAFINTYMIPYTKKPVGSRMGKGKGSVKNGYFRIKSGGPLFFFFNGHIQQLHFCMRKLKIFLPGNGNMVYNANSLQVYSGFALNLKKIGIK